MHDIFVILFISSFWSIWFTQSYRSQFILKAARRELAVWRLVWLSPETPGRATAQAAAWRQRLAANHCTPGHLSLKSIFLLRKVLEEMNWQLVEQAENINLSAPWIPGNQETPVITEEDLVDKYNFKD